MIVGIDPKLFGTYQHAPKMLWTRIVKSLKGLARSRRHSTCLAAQQGPDRVTRRDKCGVIREGVPVDVCTGTYLVLMQLVPHAECPLDRGGEPVLAHLIVDRA